MCISWCANLTELTHVYSRSLVSPVIHHQHSIPSVLGTVCVPEPRINTGSSGIKDGNYALANEPFFHQRSVLL